MIFPFKNMINEDKWASTLIGKKAIEKYMPEIMETELGKVMDKLFDGENLGKGKGGISRLTHDVVTRIELTKNAFVMALIGHTNGDLWK